MRSTDESVPVSQALPCAETTAPAAPSSVLTLPFGSTFRGELAAFANAMVRLRRLDEELAEIVERRFVDPDAEVDPKQWQRAGRWLLRYLKEEVRRAGLELN